VKTVVLVAPHFLPSFLPSVHRARLWSYYLPEFGWKPIILTTDERYYECQTAPEMLDLLPDDLEIIRVPAIPTKPIRLVGDISIRSFPFYYSAMAKLAREKKIDFIHFTVPAYSAALVGPLIYRRYGVPYGIDYIDPWVYETPAGDRVLSKAWLSQVWAKLAEPWAVRDARLITGINSAYFESVIRRNPRLRGKAITAAMPYGGSEKDIEAVNKRVRTTTLFDPEDGKLHLIYAGALLPRADDILDRFLAAVGILRKRAPEGAERLRVHFVGTGLFENDATRGKRVTPFINKHGLAGIVTEMPSRIPYLDVLNHLSKASAILVIGSTEPHYSPSKIYQAVMARRPVFALLHEESTAVSVLRNSGAGTAFTFTPDKLPDVDQLANALAEFCKNLTDQPTNVNCEAFAKSSARESARVLASALDCALQKAQ
jgi:hypothetical protein